MSYKIVSRSILLVLVFLLNLNVYSHTDTEDPDHKEELIDLIFALDDSGSLGQNNFQLQQKGFSDAFEKLLISGLAHNINSVSVIYFSSQSSIVLSRSDSLSDIRDALVKDYSGGTTNMTGAFANTITISDSIPSPDPNGHIIHKLLIMSTDGSPDDPTSASDKAQELIGKGVSLASIGVGNADSNFLNNISDNSPVPTPSNFLEFSDEVTTLVLEQFSEILGTPVVTNFSASEIEGTQRSFQCEGVAIGYTITGFEFEYFDATGKHLNGKSSISNTAVFDFPNDGVYSASCTLLVTSSNGDEKSLSKFIHFPITLGSPLDSDKDGLPDTWEENGLKDASGNVLLDLPAMGANSQCKDVFVEVDWLEIERTGPDTVSRPTKSSFKKVINAFADAPVDNPGDNCRGVNLHIDAGKNMLLHFDVMKGKVVKQTYATGGNKILDNNELIADNLYNKDVAIVQTELLDQIKDNFTLKRHGVFRYALIAPARGLMPQSGMAIGIPSPAFFSAGESILLDAFRGDNEISSTFMHELGHTLGLGHGGVNADGRADHDNYKPNYLSIMNYHYQNSWLGYDSLVTGGLDGFNTKYLDYSRWYTQDLDENDLLEASGIAIIAPINDQIARDRLNGGLIDQGLSIKYNCNNDSSDPEFSDAEDGIDWNCDGDKSDIGVAQDINYGKANKGGEKDLLKGAQHTDWDMLDYSGSGVLGYGIGIITPFEAGKRPIDPDYKESYTGPNTLAFKVNIAGRKELEVVAGGSYIVEYDLTNAGMADDTYGLTVDVSGNLQATFFESKMALQSSEAVKLKLEISIPLSVDEGDELTVFINAKSETNTSVSDSEDLVLKVIAPSIMICDANADGNINSQDLIKTINHILGVEAVNGNPDCNADGLVNSLDIVSVINKILGN